MRKYRTEDDDASPKHLQSYTLKPIEIPRDFVLVQDTREQRPLFVRIPKGLTIQSATLHDGDYSVRGFESRICFERKSMDIYNYCTVEQPKTKLKMERFKSFEFVGLVIEMKESELFQFQQYTKAHPEAIRGALVSFDVRYGVHIYYGSRTDCARWLLDRAVKFWNVTHEV
jgi:ERCC4-type nuclease